MEVASFLTIIMSWSKVLPPWSTVPTAAAGGCILFDVFFDTAAWLSLLLGVPRLRALPTSSGTFVACIGAVQSSTSMRAVVVMQRRSLWRAAFMWFYSGYAVFSWINKFENWKLIKKIKGFNLHFLEIEEFSALNNGHPAAIAPQFKRRAVAKSAEPALQFPTLENTVNYFILQPPFFY